jgi:hypothetical protein
VADKHPTDKWFFIFLLPALIILLIMSFWPLQRAILAQRFPYQLDYAEGYLAVEAWQVSRGETPYPPIHDYPYLVGNYPPVFILLQAPMFLIFGPSLFWGRLICLLCALGIAGLMVFIVRKNGGHWIPAVLAPLLFFNTYALHEWSGYARVDLPAIFFSLAGLAILANQNLTGRHLRLALIFFLLGVYTKQIQIFAPLSAIIYLVLKDWKTGLRFTAWLLGLAAGFFILFTLATGGQYFYHTVLYNANVFSWWQVGVWLRHLALFYRFLLTTVLLLGATKIWEYIGKARKGIVLPPGLFSLYAMAGAISIIAIGKVGAASNYLLECHVALGIFWGIGISRLGRQMNSNSGRILRMTLIFLVIVLTNFHAGWLFHLRPFLFNRPNPDKVVNAKCDEMLQIVRGHPDPILCEQPIFLLLAGKRVLFQPFIMSQLAREGKWNQAKFLEDVRRGKFSLIVTGQDVGQEGYFWQYTLEMRQAIREKYTSLLLDKPSLRHLMESPAGGIPYYIYVPRRGMNEKRNGG